MDTTGDFLTRIRNALMAGHRVVGVPSSKMKVAIAKILKEKGFVRDFKVITDEKGFSILKIALKYNPKTGLPAIRTLKRASTPGLRRYRGASNLPRVLNGLGIAIISTSKGVITDKEARKMNVGGEVVCYVY